MLKSDENFPKKKVSFSRSMVGYVFVPKNLYTVSCYDEESNYHRLTTTSL